MQATLKNYPLGIYTFSEIIERNLFYINKSGHKLLHGITHHRELEECGNMRRLLFLLHCLLTINMVFADNIVSASLLDAETSQPIEFAYIKCGDNYTFSNYNGEFEISTDCDTLHISHLSFNDLTIKTDKNIQDTIFMSESSFQLAESIIIPENIILQQIATLRNKYLGLTGNNQNTKAWYYKQITYVNDTCSEYIESIFSGMDGYRIPELKVHEGRWAKISSYDNMTPLSYISQFYACTKSPFENGKPTNKMYPISLFKNFEKIFNFSIEQIWNEDTNDEIIKYKITSKTKTNLNYIYLTVKSKNLQLLEYEFSITSPVEFEYSGMKCVQRDERTVISYNPNVLLPEINYIKNESVLAFGATSEHKKATYLVKSMLTKTNYASSKKGKQIDNKNNLLHILYWGDYDQNIWTNNSFVKRTEQENEIIERFYKSGLFQHNNHDK